MGMGIGMGWDGNKMGQMHSTRTKHRGSRETNEGGSAPGYEGLRQSCRRRRSIYEMCTTSTPSPSPSPAPSPTHIYACCAFQSQCAPDEASRFGLHVSRLGSPAPFLILSQQLGRRRWHARHRLRGNTSLGRCCLGIRPSWLLC